jgi:GNAT superfamily N-acetyltransferase
MEAFGIIGMTFGMTGFVFALSAMAKITKLEKQLKETGVLDNAYRVETAFTVDDDGRLHRVNEPRGGAAPRFFIGQTPEGNRWWFRHDLDVDLVRVLEARCQEEPVVRDVSGPSLRPDPYADLLAKHAPVAKVWTGPTYWVQADVGPPADAVLIKEDERALLEPYCAEWLDDVGECQPFATLLRDGHAVSLCATVRTGLTAHEAGVETHPTFRGRGYAAQVVAAWARAVRDLGRMPLYSTSWENTASLAVARTLGLIQYGATLHIT